MSPLLQTGHHLFQFTPAQSRQGSVTAFHSNTRSTRKHLGMIYCVNKCCMCEVSGPGIIFRKGDRQGTSIHPLQLFICSLGIIFAPQEVFQVIALALFERDAKELCRHVRIYLVVAVDPETWIAYRLQRGSDTRLRGYPRVSSHLSHHCL